MMVLPAGVQQNWHAQLRDLHAQGLRAVPAGRDYLGFPWSDQSRPPRAQTEVSSARSTEDRLRREIAVLRELLRKQQEQHWRASQPQVCFSPSWSPPENCCPRKENSGKLETGSTRVVANKSPNAIGSLTRNCR
ncbi:MAG: hypothetical protein R3C12_25420 [Planctomycetaceae bacterium]